MKKTLPPTKAPDLGFLRNPVKQEIPELPDIKDTPGIVVTPKSQIKKEMLGKRQFLTLPLSPELAERLYSEVFHDPARRLLKDIALELLAEGFAKRPFKGPAPTEFIARFKAKGKR